ncbi:unnamed protein product [Vitrella brassicaformis CCMP3155]|uniref:Protein kinase domain-containing protein n=1 Tax=Vitrella brassicaformis (strain CCMP3155) TaxID=1169540 RepID=A0A0G4ECZ7_VITBC|nr:unnamed protein product [Vitrella brassicaformis CCMP3155]|eukprot:CEL93870.1 unnamed protein product [Vitrella brassicaformis CCMP3155]
MTGAMERIHVYAPIKKDEDQFSPLPSLEEFVAEEEAMIRAAIDNDTAEELKEVLTARHQLKSAEQDWEAQAAARSAEEYLFYRYGLRKEGALGSGRQGKVCRAGDYAIKVLEADHSLGGMYARPTFSMYRQRGLQHCPHIARHYFSFNTCGRTVYVMEFLQGRRQACCSRHFHGDVKADNIIVCDDRAVLIDLDHLDIDDVSVREVLLAALGIQEHIAAYIADLITPSEVSSILASQLLHQPPEELTDFIHKLFHGNSTTKECPSCSPPFRRPSPIVHGPPATPPPPAAAAFIAR